MSEENWPAHAARTRRAVEEASAEIERAERKALAAELEALRLRASLARAGWAPNIADEYQLAALDDGLAELVLKLAKGERP